MAANTRDADRRGPAAGPVARIGAPRVIGAMLPKVTRHLARRRGFGEADLIAYWSTIVGREIGRRSQPERLRFASRKERTGGTLTLRVSGAWAVELMHMEPQVLERINGFLGYPAVARLKIRQAPVGLEEPCEPAPEPSLDEVELARIAARVAGVSDPDLRARLSRLGQALARRTKARS